ncbi:hypothetical protein V5799_012044 [Amblyomma americanum]|uniref:Myb/SANT-like DNA-binding domain-containing protein n=1 Tax=Amblyomma americanum TaxID=6943 RepID=A0AAQ4EFI2_AMBAM
MIVCSRAENTAGSDAGERGLQPAPGVKRGGGAPEWTLGETKLLLDYYYKYFPQVGPFKKFKNKKMLFKQVSQDLATVLGCHKTPQQCENRYKTVMRQKKKASDNNNKSGASPCPVPFDDEMRKIQSIDDSLEPEVQRDSFGVTYKLSASSSADSSADPPSPLLERSSTATNSSESGDSTKGSAEVKKRKFRASTSRMQQMQFFFDEMRAISAERMARREERENEKEKRRAERTQERQERRKIHEDKLQLIREALGLRE